MRDRRSRPTRPLALAVAAALLVAACGDSDDATTTAGAAGGDGAPAASTGSSASSATEGGDEATPATTGGEITVSHAQGETTVPVEPETVVVFDLGVLDTLDALGVPITGVPGGLTLPDEMSEYAGDDHVRVGSLFEPDYEQVNALEPDLIIVAARSSTVYPELAEIAPTIDLTVDNADFMASFRERVETLGEIFAKEDEVDAALADIDEATERIQALAADAGDALIVLTTGGEVSAYGPGSRFGIIHDVFGVPAAVPDVEAATHGDAISFEFILEAEPDLLYVLDRDATIGESGAAASQVLDNELVAQTPAWKNGEVHYLDGFRWYLAPTGLRSVAGMAAEIEASLT